MRLRLLTLDHTEDIERLLNNMEFQLHLSQNEQTLLLDKVDDVEHMVIFSFTSIFRLLKFLTQKNQPNKL